jgi:hypothetical protein
MKTVFLIALIMLTPHAHAGIKCIMESGKVVFQQGKICRNGGMDFTFSEHDSGSEPKADNTSIIDVRKSIEDAKKKTEEVNQANNIEAARLLQLKVAADQGNADAQNLLAERYYFGRGVIKDYTQAMIWFRKSAGQGNEYAKKSLMELDFNPKFKASRN